MWIAIQILTFFYLVVGYIDFFVSRNPSELEIKISLNFRHCSSYAKSSLFLLAISHEYQIIINYENEELLNTFEIRYAAGVFIFYFMFQLFGHSCAQALFCFMASNFIEYMYMLSYIFNIFLYYKFNTFFKRGLANFFNFSEKKMKIMI